MSRITQPTKCDKCGEGIALPFRVMSQGDDKIQVDLRCDKCLQEWRVEMSIEPMFRKNTDEHRAAT